MNIRYRVTLTLEERHHLQAMTRSAAPWPSASSNGHRCLLAADAQVPDERIAADIGVGTSTVYPSKQHFVEDGLTRALIDKGPARCAAEAQRRR